MHSPIHAGSAYIPLKNKKGKSKKKCLNKDYGQYYFDESMTIHIVEKEVGGTAPPFLKGY